MKTIMNIRTLLVSTVALTTALALASCQREDIPVPEGNSLGELVEVSLGLSVLPEQEGTGERSVDLESTKSIIDIEDASCIKNLWIVQYNGTGNDAILLGNPQYLESVNVSGGEIQENIKLVAVEGPSTVYFLANSFKGNGELSFPSTLGDVKKMAYPIAEENDLFAKNGADRHIIFSGWSTPEEIVSGTTVSASLSRNIVKLTLHVVNSSFDQGDSKVTVNNVRLCSVPTVSRYFPAADGSATLPESGSFATINYPDVAWTGGAQTAEATCDFTFYVPVNRRGTVTNDSPSAKGKYNPGYATYAVVLCTYNEEGVDMPISYTFFLGANLTDDFNIKANRHYTYNIEIKNKGTVAADFRIRDEGTIDYTLATVERSNCYIVNPPETDGYWRNCKIPVDRVNTFWGKGSSSQTAPYEYNENYQLESNTQWEASVIWSDFEYDKSNFRFKGGNDTYSGKGTEPIIVQVAKGARGNVLIGIKRTGSDWLWSWHLWITDYAPDDVYKYAIQPQPDVYDYGVTGGKVHRLEGTAWTGTGLYANSFVMDRNIGAQDTEYHDGSTPGTIYYQFGRKDPMYYPKSSGTGHTYECTADNAQDNVLYSIANPDVFIWRSGGGNWTQGNKYNPATYNSKILWQDPNATSGNHAKSIFDPCPTGWKLPENGWCSVFNTTTFPWDSGCKARIYKDTNVFPAFGNRYSASGGLYYVGSSGFYWSSSPSSVTLGYNLFFSSSGVNPSYNGDRAGGFAVRCLKE